MPLCFWSSALADSNAASVLRLEFMLMHYFRKTSGKRSADLLNDFFSADRPA
jgi:hypothetical protein